jgi:transcriptional regulator with XRE-family HTH domain
LLKLPLRSGLGQALREQRKSARITQPELARLAGLSVPTVRLLEAGGGNLDSWQAAVSALGLEVMGRNIRANGPFGSRLAELRRRRRLSQRELARLAGTSQPTIIVLERSGPGRLSTLERVADILGAGLYLAAKDTPRPFFTHAGNASIGQSWETPADLLSALYKVFGGFDLDPCSPRKTKPPVRAKVHFTAEDDGLSLPWRGVVFLNPPYGRTLGRWIAKARHEVESGNAKTAVALIPARTDTTYWHEVRRVTS